MIFFANFVAASCLILEIFRLKHASCLSAILDFQGYACYVTSRIIYLSTSNDQNIDIRKGNGLATLFNTIHDLRFSYFE